MGGRARAYMRHMKDWGCTASAIFSHSFEIVLSCGITHALTHQDDSAQPAQFGLGLLITQVARGSTWSVLLVAKMFGPRNGTFFVFFCLFFEHRFMLV
jgi:hypothetical protein